MKIEIEDAVIAKNFIKPRERAILEDVLNIITDEQYSAIANKYDVTPLRIKQTFTKFVERCTTT